ncbi:MAG: TonB-dependent siderophore receptor [Pseudomonadota bacterium]
MLKLLVTASVAAMSIGIAHAQLGESTNGQAGGDSVEDRVGSGEEIIVVGTPTRFGATKSETPILETPRSVTVITAQDFLDRGALTLANTLNYTAGVTGNAFGPATRSDSATIRGLDAPEYQDNLQVQFGFFNNARADVYTLEQVEVLKGPASVLYGQAAPGGIISTVSKIAGPDKLQKELVATAGNFNRYQASADLGFELSGDGTWTARFVGVYRNADTQIDFVNDDAIVIAPSITYDNGRTSITALVNYTDRNSDTDSQFLPLTATACQSDQVTISEPNVCAFAPAQQVDPSVFVGDPAFNRFDTEAFTATLFATHRFNDVLSFEGTARYRDNQAQYFQSWVSFTGDGNPRLLPDGTPSFGRTFFGGPAGSDQFALDARLRAEFDTGAIRHEILAGVNYQDVETFTDQAFLSGIPSTFNIFNPVYDGSEIPAQSVFDAAQFRSEDETVSTDFYIIDQMNIGNLIVNAGIRYSSVSSRDATADQDDEEFPITVGALYKTPIGLNPYISYAESFRATVGTDVNTGTSLQPRRGEQIEVGVKYQPPGTAHFVSVAYFDLQEDNLVDFVVGGATQPGLSIEAEGVEIEALLNLGDFAVDLDFRYLDANEVDENGTSVPRPSIPSTAASVWTMWEPSEGGLEGLRIGAGFRYSGENESNGTSFVAANGFAPTPIRVETAGFIVFDALVGYEFGNGVEALLNVRNIGNREYFSTCLARGDCFVGEERTIIGSLAYRF